MTEQTWHGIPRDKIPWQPTIDYEKCISCGKCVEFCTLGTYEFEETSGKKKKTNARSNKESKKDLSTSKIDVTGCYHG
jgi:formate hydrogenlyase subunit 6/NADH:ubiquinone oxidoreductase subunit I